MNEIAATNAIKAVINAAKATLVSGLAQGGAARSIAHLETTSLAMPSGYYAIAIDCLAAQEYEMDSRNIVTVVAADGLQHTVYEMAIRIADYAMPEPGEATAYITAHTNFRKLTDRIVKLLRETKWYPNATTRPRFRLAVTQEQGSMIRKENEVITDDSLTYMILAATLRFTLIDHCADSTALYT